jgi:hypothetical protein
MTIVHTRFDCKHELDVDVSIDDDVEVPETSVRGLGKCPTCSGGKDLVPVSGVAPQAGGQRLVVDSIMMMPY